MQFCYCIFSETSVEQVPKKNKRQQQKDIPLQQLKWPKGR